MSSSAGPRTASPTASCSICGGDRVLNPRLTLIYEDSAARATLSGGNWAQGSLRLANVQTPYFAEVARSASTQAADTQFTVDFGVYTAIAGIALGGCQVTSVARYRVRAFYDDASSVVVYDSGLQDFPSTRVDQELLDWEDPGFWEGRSRDFDDRRKGALLLHIPPAPVLARVWRIEIIDPSNPTGFIDIGRLIMGRLWQPDINFTYDGNSLDFEALTDVEESRSGVKFFNARNLRRSFSFGFDTLSEQAAMREIYRIVTTSGVHNQVVVIPDPTDADNVQRDVFIGTIGTLPSLRRSAFHRVATSFKINEAL
ncbi:hypothetical protein [Methylorubrum extorquens]|uniref:hypothetical protein n=1 Tax=Methylorubrum extorquens TaxID=408 RepID=UPI0012DB10CC|nr:hypothetical protein [Methylorubrum extorquens]